MCSSSETPFAKRALKLASRTYIFSRTHSNYDAQQLYMYIQGYCNIGFMSFLLLSSFSSLTPLSGSTSMANDCVNRGDMDAFGFGCTVDSLLASNRAS